MAGGSHPGPLSGPAEASASDSERRTCVVSVRIFVSVWERALSATEFVVKVYGFLSKVPAVG